MLYNKRHILTRSPTRVTFVGGGTDFPEFCKGGRKGHVISATIDLSCYVVLKDMFDTNVRVHHAVIETASTTSRITHKYARAALEKYGLFRGIELILTSDVMTTGSGLGASSSMMSAMIRACREMQNLSPLPKKDLALETYNLEKEAGTVCGLQDQFAAVYGGLNSMTFSGVEVTVEPIPLSAEKKKEFCDRLFLVYTNLARKETEIQSQHIQNIRERGKIAYIEEIYRLSIDFKNELLDPNPNFDCLGEILHESWIRKREFNRRVTNPYIEQLYHFLRDNGVIGGKILGAGGGGFMLALAKDGMKDALIYKLYPNFIALNFSFTEEGVRVEWRNWDNHP